MATTVTMTTTVTVTVKVTVTTTLICHLPSVHPSISSPRGAMVTTLVNDPRRPMIIGPSIHPSISAPVYRGRSRETSPTCPSRPGGPRARGRPPQPQPGPSASTPAGVVAARRGGRGKKFKSLLGVIRRQAFERHIRRCNGQRVRGVGLLLHDGEVDRRRDQVTGLLKHAAA